MSAVIINPHHLFYPLSQYNGLGVSLENLHLGEDGYIRGYNCSNEGKVCLHPI